MRSKPWMVDQVSVCWPKALRKMLDAPGALSLDARRVIADHLAAALPEA